MTIKKKGGKRKWSQDKLHVLFSHKNFIVVSMFSRTLGQLIIMNEEIKNICKETPNETFK